MLPVPNIVEAGGGRASEDIHSIHYCTRCLPLFCYKIYFTNGSCNLDTEIKTDSRDVPVDVLKWVYNFEAPGFIVISNRFGGDSSFLSDQQTVNSLLTGNHWIFVCQISNILCFYEDLTPSDELANLKLYYKYLMRESLASERSPKWWMFLLARLNLVHRLLHRF